MNKLTGGLHFIKTKLFLMQLILIFTIFAFSNSADCSDEKNDKVWESSVPTPDGFDWIQLTSDEWLKGTLKGLYDNTLEFDSDKLDYQEFDWEDVKQIIGYSHFKMRFVGHLFVTGYLKVTGDKVYITVGDEKKEFDRYLLISISRYDSKRTDIWSAKVGLGMNISQGNTDKVQYNMKANLKRRTLQTQFLLDYLGDFGLTDNVETTNSHRVSSSFDYLKTRDYYFRLMEVEYYRDPFQNINYRWTLATGIGYHLIDNPKTSWDIIAGPGYQFTEFRSVQPGASTDESTPALAAGTSFDTELTNKLDFIADYKFNIVNERSGLYMHHAIGTLEIELTDILNFDVSGIWERTERPTVRSDGTLPEKDDFKLIFTLSVDI